MAMKRVTVLGCFMCYKIWEKIDKNKDFDDDDIFLILEDDIYIDDDFNNNFIKIMNNLYNDTEWDYCIFRR